jgi:hypothetical protein
MIIYLFFINLGNRRDRNTEDRLLEQNQQLFALVQQLGNDIKEIKDELRRIREGTNELSTEVLNVSFFLFMIEPNQF